MKPCILLVLALIGHLSFYGQQLSFQSGKSISKIKFEDAQGNELRNLQSSENFFVNMEFRNRLLGKERLFYDLGMGFNRYGAEGSDPSVDNYFAWDVSYLGINLGIDYEFYRPGNFTFFLRGTVSPEFLIKGTQTLNNQVYNLVGEDEFDTPMLFLRAGLGTQYQFSENISVFVQYTAGKSYPLKGDSEKLNFIAHNLGFGILINLSTVHDSKTQPVSDEKFKELEQEIEDQSLRINELETRGQQTETLEDQVRVKEAAMDELKDNISEALFDLDPEGLQVYRQEGKIYVIMDNDLLFESGSWQVSEKGKQTVEALGRVLVQNPEPSILIEGHTDNQPFQGAGNIKNNWDLSLKRATAIVEILSANPRLNPKRLIAAGRGEHYPKASNETAEGRAMNRRIEIIINPQLDKAYELLED